MNKVIKFVVIMFMVVLQINSVVYADISTGLVGYYDFDENIQNEINGAEARVVGNTIHRDGAGKEPMYANGVSGNSILFNGKESEYGLELIDCVVTDNSFSISYDVYYTMYTQDAATFYMYMPMDKANIEDDSYIEFGQAGSFSLACASSMAIETYFNDGVEYGKKATYVYPKKYMDNLVDGVGKYNWRANWVKWTNITYVVDGFDINVYVDGKSVPVDIQYNTEYLYSVNRDTRLFLGVSHNELPVSCAIDNLYIFDRTLSENDVLELIEERDYSIKFEMPYGVEINQTVDYDIKWGIKSEDTTEKDYTEKETEDKIQENTTYAENSSDSSGSSEIKETYLIVKMICMIIAVLLLMIIVIVLVASFARKHNKNEKRKQNENIKNGNILYQIVNIRNVIIVVCCIFVVSMLWMKISNENKQNEKKDMILENIKDMEDAKNNMQENEDDNPRYNSEYIKDILIFNTTPELLMDKKHITNIGKLMSKHNLSENNIQGIMLGVDADGNGIERYYFTDSFIIKKVMKKLEEMEVAKMTSPGVTTYAAEPDWDIQFCRKDSEFGFRISGEKSNFNGYYRTTVDEAYNVAYYTAKDTNNCAYETEFGSITQLLYDEDIIEFIKDIVDENVEQIDLNEAIDISRGTEVNMEKLFGYKHTAPLYTKSLLQEGNRAFFFEFPLEGTECSIRFQKQAFTMNGQPANAVEKMELYKKENEVIDMLSATEEEILEFIK